MQQNYNDMQKKVMDDMDNMGSQIDSLEGDLKRLIDEANQAIDLDP